MALPFTRHLVTKIVLPVADMDAAADFYGRAGFEIVRYDPGYTWVKHCGFEVLHLALVPGLDRSANHAAGYVHVADARAWHAALTEAGIEASPVVDEPWEMREFSVVDPDHNLLRFGQNL